MQYVRIFGAGVRASIAIDLIRWQFADCLTVEGYYDDRLTCGKKGPGDYPVLGNVAAGLDAMSGSGCLAFVALGTRASATGCRVFLDIRSRGIECLSLVSPLAFISPSAEIGENALVVPGVFIGCGVKIGHLFCAHGGAVVEHHSHVGHNVLLGPGVAIASSARIGSHSFLWAGCSVIPVRHIGCGTLLGAVSVVTQDIPAHVVSYGR